MNNLNSSYYNKPFSHIYIEEDIAAHKGTQRILSRFPDSTVTKITHYKDVFCRSHQNFRLQKQAPALILARKPENHIYRGAPVCQDFGNQHFYYTSSIMNCVYNCEYCYLQGMYPSGNIVVFVNIDDIFKEILPLLTKHSVYLCVSYDTDLLALEGILGYCSAWCGFAAEHPNLTIEIRTKSANRTFFEHIQPQDNVIFAWTLSPEQTASRYEINVPTLSQRLDTIRYAANKGFPIRLCFDPMIYVPDWKRQYRELFETVFENISSDSIRDVSIGVFRISQDYMKQMRKQAPDSSVIQYPYDNDNGVYHYPKGLTEEMVNFACQELGRRLTPQQLFIWKS